MKDQFFDDGTSYDAIRSAAPASFMAIKEVPQLFTSFRTNDTLMTTAADLSPKPTFFSSHNALSIHYGTDALLGFHLATTFAPLALELPLSNHQSALAENHDVIRAAQIEFFAWLDAFVAFPKEKLCIRYFAGDALAFGHTLQYIHSEVNKSTGHWYRDSWSFVSLKSDRDQYGSNERGPTSFNVIDVSNLADHLGPLNTITAFTLLMSISLAATLYAEFFYCE